MSLLAHKLLCREAVSVLKKNEAPNTCAKPLVSYFNKKHLSSRVRGSKASRTEARRVPPLGRVLGGTRGAVPPARREGGRVGGGGREGGRE